MLTIALSTLPLEEIPMRTRLLLLLLCMILLSTSAYATWKSVNQNLPETGAVRVVSDAGATVTLQFSFAGYNGACGRRRN